MVKSKFLGGDDVIAFFLSVALVNFLLMLEFSSSSSLLELFSLDNEGAEFIFNVRLL